jgi:YD repeat-containing protein
MPGDKKRVTLRTCAALVLAVCCIVTGLTAAAFARQGGTTRYYYDDRGRLSAAVTPTGEVVLYEYDAAGNIRSISKGDARQVRLFGFNPGGAGVGATVTIFGTGFSTTPGENAVTFNGVNATVASADASQLVTSVPQGATTGPLAVTTPNGSAVSSKPFNVKAQPNITGFTPKVGEGGTPVAITGTGFDEVSFNNDVRFAPQLSTSVESATNTLLHVTTPSGVRSGRLSVTNLAGTALSTDDFFVPPSPYHAADVSFTGRLTYGASLTGTISSASKIGVVIFEGQAGQRISVSMSNATLLGGVVRVLTPDGVQLGQVSDGGLVEIASLPVTGTYTILVIAPFNAGSVKLGLYEVPPDLSGSIVVGGPAVTLTTPVPGQNAQLSFTPTALGQRVRLELTNVTTPGTRVSILNPGGSVSATALVGTTGGVIESPALLSLSPCTIRVDPQADATGSMTLSLTEAPDVTGSIEAGGPPLTLNIAAQEQNARITFSGTASHNLRLQISDVTIPNSTISFFTPQGVRFGTHTITTGSNSVVDTGSLPATGTYLILVDPQGTDKGAMTLTLKENTSQTGSISVDGPPVDIHLGQPFVDARISFEGIAGQPLTLQFSNVSFRNNDGFIVAGGASVKAEGGGLRASAPGPACRATIFAPNGSILGATTITGTGGVIFTRNAPLTGTYTIVLSPLNTSFVNLTMTLTHTVGAPPDATGSITVDGPPVTVTTTTPQQNAVITFDGTGHFEVMLHVSGVSYRSVYVELTNADGSATVSNTFNAGQNGALPIIRLSGGIYRIIVDPEDAATGSVTLQITEQPTATQNRTRETTERPVAFDVKWSARM